MPERTFSTSVIDRPAAIERREGDLAEQVWRGTDQIVQGRMGQAEKLLRDKGETPTTRDAVDLAYAMQVRYLAETNTEDWPTSRLLAHRLALILFELPAANEAQRALDSADEVEQARGDEYVAIVSNLNSDLGGALAIMPPRMMPELPERLMARSRNVVEGKWGLESITRADLDRSLRGVQREVAIWRALQAELPEGWKIRPSSTEEDLRGTDFIITDQTGRELRIDVKTRLTFDKAIQKAADGGWITHEEEDAGLKDGYYYDKNRDGTYTCVFDADHLGDIKNYEYHDPRIVWEFIEERFEDGHAVRPEALRKLGKSAIIT